MCARTWYTGSPREGRILLPMSRRATKKSGIAYHHQCDFRLKASPYIRVVFQQLPLSTSLNPHEMRVINFTKKITEPPVLTTMFCRTFTQDSKILCVGLTRFILFRATFNDNADAIVISHIARSIPCNSVLYCCTHYDWGVLIEANVPHDVLQKEVDLQKSKSPDTRLSQANVRDAGYNNLSNFQDLYCDSE